MAAQKGRDVLLRMGDGGAPESFTTVGGLRTKSIALNAETVDVTHADSAGQWRELLSGGGVRSASVTGAGVFRDEAADAQLRAAFFSGAAGNWELVIPDFGTLSGAFVIANLDYAGAFDGEATFALTLESAGVLSFTVL